MSDIRDGQRVHIQRNEAHPAPVYLQGQRAMEVHSEPVPVHWGPYYHQLKSEGAILVVSDAQMEAAAAERDKLLAGANEDELEAICSRARVEGAKRIATLSSAGASQAAANVRAEISQTEERLRARWNELHQATAES